MVTRHYLGNQGFRESKCQKNAEENSAALGKKGSDGERRVDLAWRGVASGVAKAMADKSNAFGRQSSIAIDDKPAQELQAAPLQHA